MPIYYGPSTSETSLLNRLLWDTDVDWNKGTSETFTGPGSEIYLTWHLNESSGTTTADSSKYNRPGTLMTVSEFLNPSLWVTGKLNNAISNPGEYEAVNYIQGGNIAGFEWNQPFSVECWFNQSAGYDVSMAGNFSSVDGKGWTVFIQEGYLRLDLNGGDGNYIQVNSDVQVTPNTYQHLVVTYDGSGVAAGVKFYLDGTLLGTTVVYDGLNSTSIVPATNNFRVMAINDTGWGWIGQIDEFNLYSIVLTQGKVNFRYNFGNGTETPAFTEITGTVDVVGTGSSAIIAPATVQIPASFVYANWHFNETSGTVIADSSENLHNGLLTVGSGPGFAAGILNNAVVYTGDTNIMYGNIAGFEYTDPFSLECWVYFTNNGDSFTLMSKYDASGDGIGYCTSLGDGYFKIMIAANATAEVAIHCLTNDRISDATWHHLVVTYDGSGLAAGVIFYVDGAAVGSYAYFDGLGGNSILNSANFGMGVIEPGVAPFFGSIDEAAIYTQVLTPAQVAFRYNSGVGTETIFTTPEYLTFASYQTNPADSKIAGQLWGAFNFMRTTPVGTTAVVKVRVADDANAMGSYGSPLVAGTDIGLSGQFIQFSVDFTGTATERSSVDYISALYVAIPVHSVLP
jgi:hypothetical protein